MLYRVAGAGGAVTNYTELVSLVRTHLDAYADATRAQQPPAPPPPSAASSGYYSTLDGSLGVNSSLSYGSFLSTPTRLPSNYTSSPRVPEANTSSPFKPWEGSSKSYKSDHGT